MTRRSRAVGAVLAVVLGTAGLSACSDFDGAYDLPLPGSVVDGDEAITVTAEFRDVVNVVPRSTVRVDDVVVGEVAEVERDGWNARVTFLLREDVVVAGNATAQIRQTSLLGEKYIALVDPAPGRAQGRLADGDEIDLSRTNRNPEVEEVLGALSFLLSGGGVAQLGTITEEINAALSGREQDLRAVFGNLRSVVAQLDDQKGDILRALEAVNDLTATLNAQRRTITDALDVTGPAVEVLNAQHDELVAMLASLQRLGRVGTRVIGSTKDDLLQQLRDLAPVLRELADAGESLGPGLNLLVSFPFPESASGVVFGDFANTITLLEVDLQSIATYLQDPDGDGDPGGVPDLPVPDLPDLPDLPGAPGVDQVTACLRSGDITSKACRRVLGSTSLTELLERCGRARHQDKAVCRALGLLDSDSGGGGLLGEGGLLPIVPGLARLGASLASGHEEHEGSLETLLSGGTP